MSSLVFCLQHFEQAFAKKKRGKKEKPSWILLLCGVRKWALTNHEQLQTGVGSTLQNLLVFLSCVAFTRASVLAGGCKSRINDPVLSGSVGDLFIS